MIKNGRKSSASLKRSINYLIEDLWCTVHVRKLLLWGKGKKINLKKAMERLTILKEMEDVVLNEETTQFLREMYDKIGIIAPAKEFILNPIDDMFRIKPDELVDIVTRFNDSNQMVINNGYITDIWLEMMVAPDLNLSGLNSVFLKTNYTLYKDYIDRLSDRGVEHFYADTIEKELWNQTCNARFTMYSTNGMTIYHFDEYNFDSTWINKKDPHIGIAIEKYLWEKYERPYLHLHQEYLDEMEEDMRAESDYW